MLTVNVLQI